MGKDEKTEARAEEVNTARTASEGSHMDTSRWTSLASSQQRSERTASEVFPPNGTFGSTKPGRRFYR